MLGSGFVEAALGRGDAVRVWNRSAHKAEALVAKGALAASSPAEAVKGAERVHLCLSDDAAVDSVLEALLPALGAGVPVVDHTTVSPAGARARAQRLGARGVGFVGAPVFMGPGNARNATGRMLAAGPGALLEALAPELRRMTGELLLLGEDLGRPAALKLAGNAAIIGLTGVLADVLAMSVESGLTAAEALQFVGAFPFGGIIAGRGARILEGDYSASFELTMARKDVRLMLESAGARPLASLPSLASRMDALLAQGYGDKDLGVLAVDTVPLKKG